MKKFTSIAAALLFAGLGFSANADTLGAPNVDPESGSYFYVGQTSSTNISVSWETAEQVHLITSIDGYAIPATVVCANGTNVSIVGAITQRFTNATHPEDTNYGDNINFPVDQFFFTTAGTYTVTIPAGVVKDIYGYENDEIVLTYYAVNNMASYEDYNVIPETGYVSSYSPYTENWSIVPVNVIKDATVYPAEDLSNVTFQFNGTLSHVNYSNVSESTYTIGNVSIIMNTVSNSDNYYYSGSTISFTMDNQFVKLNVARNELTVDVAGLLENANVNIPANTGWFLSVRLYGGSFIMNVDGEEEYNASISATYHVWDGMSNANVSTDMNIYGDWYSQNTVYELEPVVVTWDAVKVWQMDNGIQAYLFNTWNNIDNYNGNLIPEEAITLSGNKLTIDLTDESLEDYITYGNPYSIVLMQGSVVDGQGNVNITQELVKFYYVPAPAEVYPDFDGVSEILFSWPGVNSGDPSLSYEYNRYYDNTYNYGDSYNTYGFYNGNAYIVDEEGEETEIYPYSTITTDGYYLNVNLEDVTLAIGNYTLVIPAGYVKIANGYNYYYHTAETYPSGYTEVYDDGIQGGYLNDLIVYQFTLDAETGVNKVGAEENNVVYNLQGVKVMEGKDLNGLSNGIYIINGKKVVVRK